ncbi:MAG: TMEM165/GDT1 family protein [Candidatus Desulfofervidaceae bacterium]|nr:TMEM165/GDT1 family protein [Candidatus Desulfofervidaceae bacterium]MDL1970345.1 TMEM165/GDT1 family protein [Candidatus Desulfofervidaceae bacterium]
MKWETIMIVFITVFLAELGDKTQLATFIYAAKYQKVFPVFLGASLALICSSFLGAYIGGYLGRYLPQSLVKIFGGCLFILIGLIMILKR